MNELNPNLPTSEQEKDEQANRNDRIPQEGDRVTDPRDIVRTEGYPAHIREAVESPMVTPQMLNEPGDLRNDLMNED